MAPTSCHPPSLDSISLLARGLTVFNDNLLANLKPDEPRCQSLIEGSLAMCTALVPVFGYDKSAALAKEASAQGNTVRQLAYETVVGQKDNAGRTITREAIDSCLDPWSMTLPGGERSAGGQAFIPELGDLREEGERVVCACRKTVFEERAMGMEASVLAIGPFSADVADCMDYPAEYYKTTRPGMTVVTELFGHWWGSGMSTDFAKRLGISDAWDFNQHKIDPAKIDVDGLKALFPEWGETGSDCLVDLDKMLKLSSHGFQLFFRPNG